jgi:hypothetical protein
VDILVFIITGSVANSSFKLVVDNNAEVVTGLDWGSAVWWLLLPVVSVRPIV